MSLWGVIMYKWSMRCKVKCATLPLSLVMLTGFANQFLNRKYTPQTRKAQDLEPWHTEQKQLVLQAVVVCVLNNAAKLGHAAKVAMNLGPTRVKASKGIYWFTTTNISRYVNTGLPTLVT